MRVIAGGLRGRRLQVPRGLRTRPTADRVREALFASLEPLEGLRVLDLFAGTGALAIEALSRGAREAVLVERSAAVVRVLRSNLGALGLGDVTHVLQSDVERAGGALAKLGPFDLIVVDPPYVALESAHLAVTLQRLVVTHGVVAPDGCLVLEHATRTPAPELSPLEPLRSRAYGDTTLSYYAPPHGDALGKR